MEVSPAYHVSTPAVTALYSRQFRHFRPHWGWVLTSTTWLPGCVSLRADVITGQCNMGDSQVPGLGPVSIARSSQARRQDNSISFHWATNQPSGTTSARHARNPGSIPPTGDASVTRPNTQFDPAVASGRLPDISGFDPGSHSPVQQSVSTFSASLG